jgi:hypothetical protein
LRSAVVAPSVILSGLSVARFLATDFHLILSQYFLDFQRESGHLITDFFFCVRSGGYGVLKKGCAFIKVQKMSLEAFLAEAAPAKQGKLTFGRLLRAKNAPSQRYRYFVKYS